MGDPDSGVAIAIVRALGFYNKSISKEMVELLENSDYPALRAAAVQQGLIPAKDMIADCAEEVRLEVVGKCCGLNILKNDPVGTVASVAIENMRLVAEKVATDESAMERYQDLIIIDSEISTKYFNCVAYPASVEGTEFI